MLVVFINLASFCPRVYPKLQWNIVYTLVSTLEQPLRMPNQQRCAANTQQASPVLSHLASKYMYHATCTQQASFHAHEANVLTQPAWRCTQLATSSYTNAPQASYLK